MPRYVKGVGHVAACDSLTHEQRMLVYRLAGEGYTFREICCRLFKEFKKRVRNPTIEKLLALPESNKFVAKYRTEFLKTVKEIPVSNKKVRLDDLESIRQRLMRIITNLSLGKNDKNLSKFLTCSRRLIEIIALAKDEMEPKHGVSIGIGLGQGDMDELSDEELQKQRGELLRKAGISIGQGLAAPDEITEGNETEDERESSEVLLAPPEELRRDPLQPGKPDVPDLRQQDNKYKGMSSI